MASIRRFEDIECWQLARKIDNELFPLTQLNGFERDFKLKDQILNSSGSIMDNISEGFGRKTNRDFARFLSYSKGSCEEIKSQLYRAMDRGYIEQSQFQSLYDQAHIVGRKIGSFMDVLERNSPSPNQNEPMEVHPDEYRRYPRRR